MAMATEIKPDLSTVIAAAKGWLDRPVAKLVQVLEDEGLDSSVAISLALRLDELLGRFAIRDLTKFIRQTRSVKTKDKNKWKN